MKVIKDPISIHGTSLKMQKFESFSYRRSHYCISIEKAEGELLYNTVNGCIVLVEKGDNQSEIMPRLVEYWFYVPNSIDERKWINVLRDQLTKRNEIDTYTILTTLDCNARCFYCYEKGRPRISMSDKVTDDIVRYIVQKSKNKKIQLRWFGGEPLFNIKAIDYISDRLSEEGIKFKSKMVSNGSLFDDAIIKKAKNKWNLSFVQITLDGTEIVYNKRKMYTNIKGSPFKIVMSNISLLLEQGINVSIRLNQDQENTQDLIDLAKYLSVTFPDTKHLSVYNSLLFDIQKKLTDTEQKELYGEWSRLKEALESYGLYKVNPIREALRCHSCMADSDSSIMITPDGQIGKCEHYTNEKMIGSIYEPNIDCAMVDQWKEKINTKDECGICPLYPECVSLKNCPNIKECTQDSIDKRIDIIKNAVNKYYQKYLSVKTVSKP